MKKFKILLYCNVSTLNCSQYQFEHIINEHFIDSIKIDNNLWCFTVEKYNYSSMLHATEDVFYDYFEQYINDNSIIVLTELSQSSVYELPSQAVDFFSSK